MQLFEIIADPYEAEERIAELEESLSSLRQYMPRGYKIKPGLVSFHECKGGEDWIKIPIKPVDNDR